jgi:hypothetical protein
MHLTKSFTQTHRHKDAHMHTRCTGLRLAQAQHYCSGSRNNHFFAICLTQHIDNSCAFKIIICFVLFKHCDALSLAFMGVCDGERPSVFHRKICSVKNLHFFAFILYIRNFMIIIFGHQSSLNQHSNEA